MTSNYTEESLKSYNNQQLIKLFLEVQQQSNETINKLTNEIKLLKENYNKLESDISVSKIVSSLLTEQINNVEGQCWANAQYSRRECLEVVGIPSSVNVKDLEGKVCTIFHARSSNWCKYDIPNNEGVQIDSVTSTHGLEQLISEPTHILSDSSSCIDLIFTNQPNLVVDNGTHPSLHPNCRHQIIHCKINLQVEYPPPYQRHVWNYAKANKNAILSALQNVDWHRFFAKKTVHQQVNLLNEIILNIFTNFVPNKVITCDDRDPPWINDNIKNKIKWKNSMYKNYKRNGKKN